MSLIELLSRFKLPPSPAVFVKDADYYRIPELSGRKNCQPIEIANTLQHTAQALINKPTSSLSSQEDIRKVLLMKRMYKVFIELPEGEYVDLEEKMQFRRESCGITVAYADQNRRIQIRWFRNGDSETEGQFTHCQVMDESLDNDHLAKCLNTDYQEGDLSRESGGYTYKMNVVRNSGDQPDGEKIYAHHGIYLESGKPCSVFQSRS